jgi:hypothetical protein
MKNLLLIAFIGLIGNVEAREIEETMPVCFLNSDSLDSTLNNNQSKFTFEFTALDGSTNQMIYSIDGIQKTVELSDNSIEVFTSPGKHIFQFYYTENYYEVYTDSLAVKNQFHTIYDIIMERSDIIITVDKPIIYLYPEQEIDVNVKLNIEGTPTFFYPEYKNGWKFKASPSGDLTFGDKTYNYLFWEASQKRSFSKEELKSGFNVKKADVTAFLEGKLSLAGLNSKEKADFITYWGPRLAANKLNFVRFEFNEQCNRYAELEITPKPKTIYRIYITWMSIPQELEVAGQEIEQYSREGFTVLEWGGSEIR